MSLHLPLRQKVRSSALLSSAHTPLAFLVPCIHRRTLFWWRPGPKDNRSSKPSGPKNLLTEEYLKKKPSQEASLIRGDLSESSIFEDEEIAGPKPKSTVDSHGRKQSTARNRENMSAALDPDPASRKRWERKMVIREIHKRGRLSKTQLLKKQEREILSKSHDFKTSVKKLMLLARQIAGKTVEDAIVQMRFSKKKAAKDVRDHLEHVRNEAIVKRGMGLGQAENKSFKPMQLQMKDGRRIKVDDPSRLYVSQAWVGKGLHSFSPDHRARGRIHLMTNPTTSLSVILKEEATRIRLHEERQKKIKNRKVWVQLPNRPVTAQRQHYSW